MASASVPVNYDYTLVPIDPGDLSKGNKEFWDGGILSNTPLRELIPAHEDYWNAKRTERALIIKVIIMAGTILFQILNYI